MRFLDPRYVEIGRQWVVARGIDLLEGKNIERWFEEQLSSIDLKAELVALAEGLFRDPDR